MAGARRRSYKKKRVSYRRKSRYTKRKPAKKTYRNRRATKRKTTKRKYKRRASKGPSLAEMAFVVAKHHPDAMAVDNAHSVAAALDAAKIEPSLFQAAFQDINEDKDI
jgi:hypothetical protein